MQRIYRQARSVILLTALAASLPAAAAAEDLTIVSRVTPAKGSPTTSTQYISEAKVRTSDGTSDTIVDIATGSMIFIEHNKKRYYETSFDEIRAHFAQLEEMLESNPMLGKLFGGATEVTVEKGTETRQIAGYTCHKYDLAFGPKFRFEVWAAPQLKPPIEYYDARKALYASIGPFASRFERMIEEMKKIDGLALATVVDTKIMGMNMHTESEATEVKKGPIPPEAFAPPAGYKQKKSPYGK